MYAIPKVVLICSAILFPLILMITDNPKNVGKKTELSEVQATEAQLPVQRHRFDIEKLANGFR
jgi:hypothetical protein